MRVFVIVGTRPEAIKMAPVHRALAVDPDLTPVLVSTGQHREMLDQVLDWFRLTLDHDLDLMIKGQTLNGVMSAAMAGLDRLIEAEAPDAILAQGDTATVCAAALAAFNRAVPFGHVEAGLRTRDLAHPYPEEGYRQAASRFARWHFCPTPRARQALADERVGGTPYLVGNTVVDALLDTADRVAEPSVALTRDRMVLITGHRRENHGARFDDAFGAIAALAEAHPDTDFVYPVHLNPAVRGAAQEHLDGRANITLIEPVPYPEMVALMRRAELILTDSGGVQEEAPSLGVPVLVMRETTERQEAVEAGVCELVGTDRGLILRRASDVLSRPREQTRTRAANPFGDGQAAARIADILAGREPSPMPA